MRQFSPTDLRMIAVYMFSFLVFSDPCSVRAKILDILGLRRWRIEVGPATGNCDGG
jgi:hypothetical protein